MTHAPPRSVAFALIAGLAACGSDSTGLDEGDDGTLSLVLEWPVPGVDGADWVINNYVDLDPTGGFRDYRGGTKVYDGHRGTDIDVPNFRWMDNDHPIVAAHAGEVVAVGDGQPDRNTSCSGTWNHVQVRHADGSTMIYGHMKQGSIAVSVGQAVAPGDPLGVVGSSGCSTAPHLHLELLGPDGAVVDPFQQGLWANPPRYDTPLDFMDIVVKAGTISGIDELKDPAPNASAASLGGALGIGLSMAGGGPGDAIRVTVEDARGALIYDLGVTFGQIWRHTYWYWNRTPLAGAAGDWTIQVYTNGALRTSYTLAVL